MADDALLAASERWPPSRSSFRDAYRARLRSLLASRGLGAEATPLDTRPLCRHLETYPLDSTGGRPLCKACGQWASP